MIHVFRPESVWPIRQIGIDGAVAKHDQTLSLAV